MTGPETFEFAAAIAGVSIGLAAVLILAVMSFITTWRLFRQSSDASQASAQAAIRIEELVRRLAGQGSSSAQNSDDDQFAHLREQAEELMEQQRRMQETVGNLLDTEALDGDQPSAVDDLETSISRLDNTVGQMAASLANLIQLLEGQQERR